MAGSGSEDASQSGRRGLSRRELLTGAGGVVAGGAIGAGVALSTRDDEPAAAPHEGHPRPPLRVFTDTEAATVAAMAERVFPADADGPGAGDAGVMHYIDGQLAGGWGTGERWYTQGPFFEPTDSGHGWQLPLAPRDVYKRALDAIDAHCSTRYEGAGFSDLSAQQQDEVMTALEEGKVDLGLARGKHGFTSSDFFTMLLQNVKEGLFADPLYGGNRDLVGWKWIGYPGDPMAHGNEYYKHFGKWHEPYEVEPQALH